MTDTASKKKIEGWATGLGIGVAIVCVIARIALIPHPAKAPPAQTAAAPPSASAPVVAPTPEPPPAQPTPTGTEDERVFIRAIEGTMDKCQSRVADLNKIVATTNSASDAYTMARAVAFDCQQNTTALFDAPLPKDSSPLWKLTRGECGLAESQTVAFASSIANVSAAIVAGNNASNDQDQFYTRDQAASYKDTMAQCGSKLAEAKRIAGITD